jgi:hypothetical protein
MSLYGTKSPAQKAHDTRLRNTCTKVCDALRVATTMEQVDAALRLAAPSIRGDVFWRLDNDYYNTPNHGLLRTFRNSPGLLAACID